MARFRVSDLPPLPPYESPVFPDVFPGEHRFGLGHYAWPVDIEDINKYTNLPKPLADAVHAKLDAQEAARGDWPDPRKAEQGQPPWPDPHDPILEFLLYQAKVQLDAGADATHVMLMLGVHAWFEGGVENYDRGRQTN